MSKIDIDPIAHECALAVLAERFENGKILRCNTEGCFWWYTGTFWTPCKDSIIKKTIFEYVKSNLPNCQYVSDKIANRALNILRLELLTSDLEENSNDETIINCLNTELILNKDGTFITRPHSPDTHLQYCLNVEYEEIATAPRFKKAIEEIFSECSEPSEVIRHFEEICAYTISNERYEPVIVMYIGKGSNGKTRISQTLMKLLNENSVLSTSLQTLTGDAFASASLQGKRLLIDDDLDADTTLPDGKLKKISEEKTTTARFAHGKPFTFKSGVVPLLIGNHLPKTNDFSDGMRRRMHIFKFDRQFQGAEKNEQLFHEIWENELSGILNIFLDAYSRFAKRGRFDLPLEMKDNVDEWFRDANVVPAFVNEACNTDEEYSKVKGTDLFIAFKAWAKGGGYTSLPNRNDFYNQVEKLGFKRVKPGNATTFVGINI